MREVTVTLRFTQVCPGDSRMRNDRGIIFGMQRNKAGQVIFPPTWWRTILAYAAKIHNHHAGEVEKIRWDPAIVGTTRIWHRYLDSRRRTGRRRSYAVHEAFLPGDDIQVHCLLPNGLTDEAFQGLLETAGTYCGISPYKPGQSYGTFDFLAIGERSRDPGDRLENVKDAG